MVRTVNIRQHFCNCRGVISCLLTYSRYSLKLGLVSVITPRHLITGFETTECPLSSTFTVLYGSLLRLPKLAQLFSARTSVLLLSSSRGVPHPLSDFLFLLSAKPTIVTFPKEEKEEKKEKHFTVHGMPQHGIQHRVLWCLHYNNPLFGAIIRSMPGSPP